MTEERDPHVDGALSRLRETTTIPPVDPEREQALLAAFDAHWARPRRLAPRAVWISTAAAASLVIALALGRRVITDATVTPATPEAAVDLADFVAWPGAEALPPIESGEVRRIDLPRAALPALGLPVPFSATPTVPADVVIGQDGLARAVRLVHQQ